MLLSSRQNLVFILSKLFYDVPGLLVPFLGYIVPMLAWPDPKIVIHNGQPFILSETHKMRNQSSVSLLYLLSMWYMLKHKKQLEEHTHTHTYLLTYLHSQLIFHDLCWMILLFARRKTI